MVPKQTKTKHGKAAKARVAQPVEGLSGQGVRPLTTYELNDVIVELSSTSRILDGHEVKYFTMPRLPTPSTAAGPAQPAGPCRPS